MATVGIEKKKRKKRKKKVAPKKKIQAYNSLINGTKKVTLYYIVMMYAYRNQVITLIDITYINTPYKFIIGIPILLRYIIIVLAKILRSKDITLPMHAT